MTQETGSPNQNSPPVDRLAQLWRRINEHKIVQWSIAYIAVAYAVQQGLMLMGAAFDWPEAVLRASMLLLILGLPLVVTLAWYHGERASRHFSAAELTIISLLLVIGAIVFYAFVQPQQEIATDQAPPAQQAGVEKAKGEANAASTAISVAVLPFSNLSGDANQEFFSDGITEEITAALAKVQGLTVLGRTSAFQFKGQNRDLRDIGQALGASHLIEGSVRKAGMRVRITAQLIRADSGAHLWTENYDRELADIFAIQEDIAQAIAAALRVPLGLPPGGTLIASRTDNLESYEQYLRGRALYRARSNTEAIKILEPLVARDPSFAPAWGLLAIIYAAPATSRPAEISSGEYARRVTRAAREAIRLNPQNAPAYGALADVDSRLGRWTAGEDGFRRVLALDPNEPEILNRFSARLAIAGRIKEALSIREKLQTLEPFVPLYNLITARLMIGAGQARAAATILEKLPADLQARNLRLARAYAIEGRYAEAADVLLAEPGRVDVSRRSIEDAARLLRSAPQRVSAGETLPSLEEDLNFVYAHIGALDRILDNLEREMTSGSAFGTSLDVLWGPESAPLRKTERFKKFVHDSGLYDYWRARGWADLCHPLGANDFECS